MQNLLTTATPHGVITRYLSAILGAIVATVVTLGYLNEEQGMVLGQNIDVILGAIGGIIAIVVPVYAAKTKSSSDKAAEVAKEVDKNIAPATPVEIITPDGEPNIVVPAKP